MKSIFSNNIAKAGATVALAAAAFVGGGAHAANTAASTSIANLATLSYTVGTINQTPIGSSPTGNLSGAGTSTTFVVDNKVNLNVVTTDAANIQVINGSTAQVATFTVTNTGNSTQDFSLSPSFAYTNGTASPFGGTTDSFNPSACSAVVESGATAGYQAGVDLATFIDELASGSSKTVYVVCDIPLATPDTSVGVISLTAQALIGGTAGQGGTLTETPAGAETAAAVDIVFADAAVVGISGGDAARDAKHSAYDAFVVQTSVLTVTKTAATVCDPVKGTTNALNIPGAFVRYTVTIANTGSGAALLTAISDTLDANVTFDSDFITGASAAACVAGSNPVSTAGNGFKLIQSNRGFTAAAPKWMTTGANSDGAQTVAGVIAVDFAQALPAGGGYTAGQLKSLETVQVIYQVEIK